LRILNVQVSRREAHHTMVVLAKASRAHGEEKRVFLVLALFLSSLWQKLQSMSRYPDPAQAVAKFEAI
jgi:hypothetical protein